MRISDVRHEALRLSLQFHSEKLGYPTTEQVLETAELFHEFLRKDAFPPREATS